jgi:CubicO group peptidase (beta-lactamase class C family)
MRFRNYLVILAMALSITAQSQKKNVSELEDEIAKHVSATGPGMAVLVVEKGKPVLRKGYGLADIENKIAVQPDMSFKIGSITKQFTAVAILKLVQAGKLNVQDDITKYLPEFKTEYPITIEHLLNHTSGIRNYLFLPQFADAEARKKEYTITELNSIIQQQPADFAPGEYWSYTNSGYYLLGSVIEKVSGMPYEQYVTTMLKPLGMKTTFIDGAKPLGKMAVGYEATAPDEYKRSDFVHPSLAYAAGIICSTVDDMWKWNKAVFSYKVTSKELLEKAWSPTKLTNGLLESYGYGWEFGKVGEYKAIAHGGANFDGYSSFELYVPEKEIFVCILTNNISALPENLAYTLAEKVAGVNKLTPAAIELDEKVLDNYVGVYKINDREERVITRNGKQLYSQRTGGGKFEIYPYTNDKVAFSSSSNEIHFIRNNDGNVVGLEFVGRSFVNQRATKTDKQVPAEKLVYTFNPQEFDVYEGEYELAPGFTLKVWRENDLYKTQGTGQPAVEIFPEGPAKFFLKIVEATIEFKRDEAGVVNGMILHQAGQQIPGKKIK